MAKEEFVAKLQMVYVGDRNAFNELVTAYGDLEQKIKELENINDKLSDALDSAEQRIDRLNKYMKEHSYDYVYQDCKFNEIEQYEDIKSILQGEEV